MTCLHENLSALDKFYEEINSSIIDRDAKGEPISKAVFQRCTELGLYSFGIHSSRSSCSPITWGKHLEQLGYRCLDSGLALLISLRAGLANTILSANKSALNHAYQEGLRIGSIVPAFAYTDGADPFSFNTQAHKVEGGYVVNGKKLYVTGGATADLFVVYANKSIGSGTDLGVFLIQKESKGLKTEIADLAGLRTAGIATLILENCFVPIDHVLQEHDGLSHVQKFLNERRLFLVSPLIGQMRKILEHTIDELSERIRYNAPLTSMQFVQAQLGRMYTLYETAKASLYSGLLRQASSDFDTYWDPVNSSAKLFIVEAAIELVQISQRLLGGDGYLRSQHVERFYRDFAGYIPGGGSQDTLLVDLGINAITKRQMLAIERRFSQDTTIN
ncbi:MAG TPA: acyl-CoA dehydrogenase [Cellvibrionaceae bacterium]|nr:acyl-CoA dehydrogenase [Cellvibrionaceae bacterium]HNG58543.1 acyl-CoA dehydrogenase [Cellvibrionaceae bacterium]